MNNLIREIQKTPVKKHDKLINLVGRLQGKAELSSENPDLIFYGIAFGLEKVADYRIYEIHDDDRLNELSEKISKIEEREGLDKFESFVLGDPDTPEDYQALNVEFEHRLGELRRDIMKEFGEEDMADLFWDNWKAFYQKFYSGLKILEKNNPDKLKEIEELEKEDLAEGEL